LIHRGSRGFVAQLRGPFFDVHALRIFLSGCGAGATPRPEGGDAAPRC
jgi:hypothetical protein